MNPQSIVDAGPLSGKYVLVRVDWNVPIKEGRVVDDYRIQNTLATLEYIQKSGAKTIIISHVDSKEGDSLLPVYEHVNKFFPLNFCSETVGTLATKAVNNLQDGDVLLLENLRRNDGEELNSSEFAESLAKFADVFVNEAFSESHRKYASIVGIPEFIQGFIGIRFNEEIAHLSKAFYPKRPFLLIMGGAKFNTKLPIIKKFLGIADNVFIGGALANDFFREMKIEVGKSLVSKEGEVDIKEMAQSEKVKLPSDVVVKRDGNVHIVPLDKILPDDIIVDAGPNTLLELKELIARSSSVLWNGPLGGYEEGYRQPTLELARFLADSGKETILGGGDTLAAIRELQLSDKFSFVSTGGGAMLDFLAAGTLPGIEALSPKAPL
jgi:phosphoglycerate kinase